MTRASTQSKPLSLGERAQEGTPITGTSPSAPNIIRLPGSTGMPRCSTSPPALVTAMGITSPRSTMADAPNTRIGSQPSACISAMAAVTSRNVMRDHAHRGERAAQRRDPLTHRLFRLGDDRWLGLRQPGDDEPRPLVAERRDAHQRLAADDRQRLVQHGARHGEGDDLHGRHHLALLDDGEGLHGGERQALMQAVQRPHPLDVDDGEAVCRRHGDWRGR